MKIDSKTVSNVVLVLSLLLGLIALLSVVTFYQLRQDPNFSGMELSFFADLFVVASLAIVGFVGFKALRQGRVEQYRFWEKACWFFLIYNLVSWALEFERNDPDLLSILLVQSVIFANAAFATWARKSLILL